MDELCIDRSRICRPNNVETGKDQGGLGLIGMYHKLDTGMPACDLAVSDVNRIGMPSSKEAYCDLYAGGGSNESTMLSCMPRNAISISTRVRGSDHDRWTTQQSMSLGPGRLMLTLAYERMPNWLPTHVYAIAGWWCILHSKNDLSRGRERGARNMHNNQRLIEASVAYSEDPRLP
ncbi:hypothetical protein L226DRAFT_336343 [Lentinus tigrinus ALCF2SS1-7]|uniref:uncharacterized protein n=1 Tax=Lentinus tigrinus ALCF2SS1-7 TaxID=1328758 RepID=UPI0011661FEE|nr:hypothetical protein L226DRAFT_336343 [Lentinus tigrinus ALCF2SS1-7]